MIQKQELLDLAKDFGLQPNVVEKDYLLGWLLAGIGEHPATRHTWVFKGGTCLKKCFFETYRFSEDLDFTLTDPAHLDEAFLHKLFQEVGDWVYEQTGLVLPPEARKFEVYTNPRGGTSAEGRVGYRGPLARAGDAPRIKLDLTDHERLVLPIDRRSVHHPYSDLPQQGIQVSTYCFEEVFAEKVRALAERLRPRDLYDVVHLYRRRKELAPDLPQLMHALREKCEFKKIGVPDFASIQASPLIAELQVSWGQMLAHQLPELPPFDGFWAELPNVFDWLHSRVEQPALAGIAVGSDTDTSWRMPAMASSWRSLGIGVPMEVIRFAAANRLCIQLGYRKVSGERTQPVIEPYSLRRTRDGNYLLYGVKADTGENRSYRVDQISGATVTQRPFTARYVVELTETGIQPVPSVARPVTATRDVFRAPKPFAAKAKSGMGGGPKHTFRCTACGKTFTRSTYDGVLNEHKNKQGYPCFGRVGAFVKTQY